MNNGKVCGVGTYLRGKFTASKGNKITKEYRLWTNVLARCYDPSYHVKYPTYEGCTVSENFKNFQFFAEWCNNQIGFGNKGWHLDKDILVVGNKEYSENACVFVPKELNLLLVDSGKSKGKYPIGVCYDKSCGMFKAYITKYKVIYNLGRYECPKQAHKVYCLEKKVYVKQLAEQYKDIVDVRVYNALVRWQPNFGGN